MVKQVVHKPVIETGINGAALVFIATGTNFAIKGDYYGLLLVVFGVTLEFFKYWGRKKEYW